jgi:serine/threonine-protein kinase
VLLLGRYQLLRQIGRGGMAEVWEAHALGDRGFTRRVAVKRLTERGSEMERMFVDEARIASRLHHLNVVAVLDFGVADGVPFQVLEYVDGLDAEALLARARERGGRGIPVVCALHVAAEVARGLEHAHQARGEDGHLLGIVHRDVSPNNVLVAWTGEVKLGDFGIAFARDRAGATQAGTTKGKPSYMAPEQMTRGTLDPRTDLFALGCTLHALAAGASPLSGEDRMADLLSGKPLPLSEDLPEDVRAIVARATRRSRGDRYEDAGRLAAACDEAARAHASDPRRAFLEWLGTLRPAPAPPEAGALDWLFSAAPGLPAPATATLPATDVAAPATTAATQTSATISSTDTMATPPLPPAPATPAAVMAAPPRPRRRIALMAAAAVAIVGGVAALLVRSAEDVRLQPAAFESRSLIPAPSPEATVASAPQPPAPVHQPEVTVTAPATPAPPRETAPSPPRAAPAPARPASSRPRAPEGTGFLQVSGEVALRKEILVDGQSAGFAPKVLELGVGPHQLELRGEDGAVVGSRRVEITSFDTRSAPARWTPESPP